MFLSTNPAVVQAFLHNYAMAQSFMLAVDLQRGAKVSERFLQIDYIAEAAFQHHERFHNARL